MRRTYFPFKFFIALNRLPPYKPRLQARRTIMLPPGLRVLWFHRRSCLTCQQARSSPCLCCRCCCWLWLLACAGRGSTTTSMNGTTQSSSGLRSPPDTARCGPCRRKCRSRRFPSSWPAADSESLTPKGLRPARAAPSCRTRTDGETVARSLLGLCRYRFRPGTFVFFPPLPSTSVRCVYLRSYYEYMFGSNKRQGLNKGRRTGPSELTELQVLITSTDSECDAYPKSTSDESCESLPSWYYSLSTVMTLV